MLAKHQRVSGLEIKACGSVSELRTRNPSLIHDIVYYTRVTGAKQNVLDGNGEARIQISGRKING